MPVWLNAVWSTLIIGSFIYGLYSFGNKTFDNSQGWSNYKDFIIPGASLIGYAAHYFLYNLFTNADLATTMMVALIFIAIITGIAAGLERDKDKRSFLFSFATGFGALGLAIPFGERLKNSDRRRRNVDSNRKNTDKTKTTIHDKYKTKD